VDFSGTMRRHYRHRPVQTWMGRGRGGCPRAPVFWGPIFH
jgi:hypothetical protein